MAIFPKGMEQLSLPDGFMLRNQKEEMDEMRGFFGELKTSFENFGKLSEKEILLASINRLDLRSEDLDMTDCDIVQRIGVCRRLALAEMADGMELRASDYLKW